MKRTSTRCIITFGASVAIALTAPAAAQTAGSAQTRNYIAAAGELDAFEMLEADTVLTQSSDK